MSTLSIQTASKNANIANSVKSIESYYDFMDINSRFYFNDPEHTTDRIKDNCSYTTVNNSLVLSVRNSCNFVQLVENAF